MTYIWSTYVVPPINPDFLSHDVLPFYPICFAKVISFTESQSLTYKAQIVIEFFCTFASVKEREREREREKHTHMHIEEESSSYTSFQILPCI
jgi:hypothetical protein